MKIFTVTFDTATLSPARIWVAPYSQFAVGVKVFVNGTEAEGAVTIKKDGAAIPAEESKVGGFTVFQTASGETGSAEYEISVAGLSQKMKLVQVTTDSTVFEVGGGGEVPADVATKSWVNSQISDFVDEDALTAYATKDELTAYAETADLTAYAEKTDLTAYAEKTDLTAYATTDSLTAYATTDSLTAYAETADLTAYYTKSETSSATELANAFQSKVTGGAQTGTTGTPAAVNAVKSVYETDWQTLSAAADANTFYVIVADPA